MTNEAPMTIAQLIEHLKQFDPLDAVMIDCSDEYYSGPLTPDKLSNGNAILVSPFDWVGPAEDARGRPCKPEKGHYPGGWRIDLEGENNREFTERKGCVIIRAE